jgi:ribose transport system substrate-binding protein
MKRREFLVLSASAVAAVPGLRWVGTSAQEASPAASPAASPSASDPLELNKFGPVKANKPYKLAFLQPYPQNEFWQRLQKAAETRAAADGVTLQTFALGSTEVADQVSQMEAAVSQKFDGILLGAINAAGIVPGVQAANDANIPVLAVDTPPEGGKLINLSKTDNVKASASAGDFIADKIGGSGKVLNLQGDLGNQNAQARNEGLHQALEKHPEIKIIDQSAHWNQDEGLSITENILTSDPDLKAIFGANDPAALGAVQAVKAAGRNDIVIVGLDGNPTAFQAVIDGDLAADIAQFPPRMGAYGVDLMVRFLNGETIPELVDTGTAVVTKENAPQMLQLAKG